MTIISHILWCYMLFLSCLKSLHPRINHNIWTWFGIFMGTWWDRMGWWWDSVTITHHKTVQNWGHILLLFGWCLFWPPSHGWWMEWLIVVVATLFWPVGKTTAIRVVSEVITSFRMDSMDPSAFYKEDQGSIQQERWRSPGMGRMEGAGAAPQRGAEETQCFILCFWYFVLESFFQSGLESPRQFLLWAGEPKVYLMLFHLLWAGEPKVNLRLLLWKTLSWWGWYRGYL